MKVRTDFVTNSSSSSFVIRMICEFDNGEEETFASKEEMFGDFDFVGVSVFGDSADTDQDVDFDDYDEEYDLGDGEFGEGFPQFREYHILVKEFRKMKDFILYKLGMGSRCSSKYSKEVDKMLKNGAKKIIIKTISEGQGENADNVNVGDALPKKIKNELKQGKDIRDLAEKYNTDENSIRYFTEELELSCPQVVKTTEIDIKEKRIREYTRIGNSYDFPEESD